MHCCENLKGPQTTIFMSGMVSNANTCCKSVSVGIWEQGNTEVSNSNNYSNYSNNLMVIHLMLKKLSLLHGINLFCVASDINH